MTAWHEHSPNFGQKTFKRRITVRGLDINNSIESTFIERQPLCISDSEFQPRHPMRRIRKSDGVSREVNADDARRLEIPFHKRCAATSSAADFKDALPVQVNGAGNVKV